MDSPSQSARVWIVTYSLGITGILIIFLILARQFDMRFDYGKQENLRLIDIVLPTFLGYLGSASHFIFNANRGREIEPRNASLLRLLVHGPFFIFAAMVCALFYAYYASHRPLLPDEARIDRMDFAALSRYLSVSLGLLAATVGIISSYLFGSPPTPEQVDLKLSDNAK